MWYKMSTLNLTPYFVKYVALYSCYDATYLIVCFGDKSTKSCNVIGK